MNLYHYCSTDKCFNILRSKNIRLSDISKSNDFSELELLFPDLFQVILNKYLENPFPFKFNGLIDSDAMYYLVEASEETWDKRFEEGSFTNFILCFSEVKDSLSQWRGYADNGQGCCLGFSKDILQQFCDSTKGILRFEKVEYVTQDKIDDIIEKTSDEILEELRVLRKWIIENMIFQDNSTDTDGLLWFNFNGLIENVFTDSLRLKSDYFFEKREWRIFLAQQAYKEPNWVLGKNDKFIGPNMFNEILDFLNNRIDFSWTDNDLIPFYPLNFEDFSTMPITEFLVGPKSQVRNSDIKLFLRKYGYPEINIQSSSITYR